MYPLIPHNTEKKGEVSKNIYFVISFKNFSLLGRSNTLVRGDGVVGLSEGSHSSGNGNVWGYPLGSLSSSCDNDGSLDDPLHFSLFSEEWSAFEDLPTIHTLPRGMLLSQIRVF